MTKEEKRARISRLGRIWEEGAEAEAGQKLEWGDQPLFRKAIEYLRLFGVCNVDGEAPSVMVEIANVGRVEPGARLQVMVRVTPGDQCRLLFPSSHLPYSWWEWEEIPTVAITGGVFRYIWDKVSLGLKVSYPSSWEEAPSEEPPPTGVEPEVELEERPWEELGITEAMWDWDLRQLLGGGVEATRVYDRFARDHGITIAGPALRLLNTEDWRPGRIRYIGPKRITLLREAFEIAGYFDQEEDE